jgi:hypothetical protein
MKTTLIAEHGCKDWADLAAISGVGPTELETLLGRGAGNRHAG